MTLLKKIPGTLLIFLGALCLSFGGLIVKSFEGANLWQILFWRQFFFSIVVALYLLISYKKNFLDHFMNLEFLDLLQDYLYQLDSQLMYLRCIILQLQIHFL